MHGFSLDRAWSRGVAFVSERARDHAIILIGVGVLLSSAIQFAAVGGPVTFLDAERMGESGDVAALGAAFLAAAFIGYVLQMGSFFASWRLGLGRGETLGGALGWGMVAALLFVLLAIALVVLGSLATIASPALGAVLIILLLVPLAIILYSVFAVMMALFLAVAMLIVLLFGATMAGSELFAAGEGAAAILISFAVSLLTLWLSARLCCTGPAMARHRSFNPFAGMAESWRATAAAQWRILGYLSLVAVVVGILGLVLALIVGVSVAGILDAPASPQLGIGLVIGTILGGTAMAYILVTIPVGIYRAVSAEAPVDVFA